MSTYDLIVLGGGPGGYPCAIRAGQLGLKVACIEEEEVGGVCVNWGCIPSKALIANAHFLTKSHHIGDAGIAISGVSVDPNKMQDWKNGIVKKMTGGVRSLLKTNGATLVEGRGKLVDKRTVEVAKKDGTTERLTAQKAIVIATGSATIQVPGFEFDGERIIGAREAVNLRAIPKRLVVVGGGVIGLELGMVYQSFGSELTVVELTPSLLPGTDPDCVRVVEKTIAKRNGVVFKSAKAEGWEKTANGVAVTIASAEGTKKVECDVVLVAVGMKPRSRGIGLEEAGVAIDPRGFVTTNPAARPTCPASMRSAMSGVPMLAQGDEGGQVCAEVIAGRPRRLGHRARHHLHRSRDRGPASPRGGRKSAACRSRSESFRSPSSLARSASSRPRAS
jgi:dihydrolipoamide dehydrogenase